VLGDSEARDGQDILAEHFPGGSGSPAQIVVAKDQLSDAAKAVGRLGEVESMTVVANDSPSGTLSVGTDGEIEPPRGRPGACRLGRVRSAGETPTPTEVDGNVLLEATLTSVADSDAAESTVTEIRDRVHDIDAGALVGGESAVDLDTNTTAEADRALAIPLILVVVTIVLILLLRSLLAPLLLVAADRAVLRHCAGRLRARVQRRHRLLRSRPLGAALRVRLPRRARHRLQHLPHVAGCARSRCIWEPGRACSRGSSPRAE
jgi:RND superfamily putative drug exporter